MNCADSESRPVLGPAGNKARLLEARKPVSKPQRKVEKPQEIDDDYDDYKAKKAPALPIFNSSPSPPQSHCVTVPPSILKKKNQKVFESNLSLNASCSSDASSDSSQSRASNGRISRRIVTPKSSGRKQLGPKSGKVEKIVSDSDSVSAASVDTSLVKKRCAWVTPNTEPCYAAFHDEEWGVPVHEDKRLFELLILSTALAELTWPSILNKRHIFREVFLDFDPIAISKLNEKKIVTPGSPASSLLSELKLRGILENARQTCKILDEFGSFEKYIWGFVNHKPIVGQFRYPRQIPIKISKADAISKDLVRRGFRGVGPTVVYSFMQVAGVTNDHLVTCFRFRECIADKDDGLKAKVEEKQSQGAADFELIRAIDDLSLSTS